MPERAHIWIWLGSGELWRSLRHYPVQVFYLAGLLLHGALANAAGQGQGALLRLRDWPGYLALLLYLCTQRLSQAMNSLLFAHSRFAGLVLLQESPCSDCWAKAERPAGATDPRGYLSLLLNLCTQGHHQRSSTVMRLSCLLTANTPRADTPCLCTASLTNYLKVCLKSSVRRMLPTHPGFSTHKVNHMMREQKQRCDLH